MEDRIKPEANIEPNIKMSVVSPNFKFRVLYQFLLVLAMVFNTNCSDSQSDKMGDQESSQEDSQLKISPIKRKIMETNYKLRGSTPKEYPAANYKPKFDLNNYKYNQTNKYLSRDGVVQCINDIILQDDQIKEKAQIRIDSRDEKEIIKTHYWIANQSNIYAIRLVIWQFEDYETAKMALENELFSTTQWGLIRDDNCLLDFCFTNERKSGYCNRILLWANLIIYISARSAQSQPQPLNQELLDRHSLDLQKKMLNCFK